MLGLSISKKAALTTYRRGHPIAGNRDTVERAGHLLAIHKNLLLLFPKNRDLAYRWISTPNKAFEGRTPAGVIDEFGFSGLLMVHHYLDRQLGAW